MAALSIRVAWVLLPLLLLLLLAVFCMPTTAASDTGEAAEGEGSGEAKSSREAGQTSRRHTTSSAATHDLVVFPGRSTGRPDARRPTMGPLLSYFPFWPPVRHSDLRPELREEADDPPSLQRFPRHFPLVQARHQRNNPWRQARQQGYMARGQPQRSSSLWYWD